MLYSDWILSISYKRNSDWPITLDAKKNSEWLLVLLPASEMDGADWSLAIIYTHRQLAIIDYLNVFDFLSLFLLAVGDILTELPDWLFNGGL